MVQIITPRYSRQEIIDGWNQNILNNQGIAIVGSNNLASFLATDFLAMGFGSVTKLGENTLNFLNLSQLNPDVEFTEVGGRLLNETMASDYVGKPSFLIIASSSEKEREVCVRYAQKARIPTITASAYPSGFVFIDSSRYSLEETLSFLKRPDQDKIAVKCAIIGSGIVANEVRKRIMPLKNERILEKIVYSDREELPFKKVLLVGVGAIGTFASIGLAMNGISLTLADFDRVELANLNRQILFYDSVGSYKSEAAAAKLSNLTKTRSIVKKIDETYSLDDNFDAIFGCVDNPQARLALDKIAARHNVKLIDGGTSINSGKVIYVGSGTACLDCQNLGQLRKTPKEKPDGSCYEPSTIISNQIVGGLMMSKLSEIAKGNYDLIKYDSSFGFKYYQTMNKCQPNCAGRNK